MPVNRDRNESPPDSYQGRPGGEPRSGSTGLGGARTWLQGLYGYGLVLIAAVLWATIGLFYERLVASGVPPITVVFFRAALTAVMLFIGQSACGRGWPRLKRRDLPLFLSFGLVGVAAFWAIYVHAVALIGMGMAAVLMYTAPAWVTILSVVFLGERPTWPKVAAVLLAFGGCALVSRIYDPASVRLNLVGILIGLGSGFGYGLYILFSKAVQRRYNAGTALAYALGLGALFLLPLQSADALVQGLTTPSLLAWLLVLALVPTLGGGLAFTAALRRVPAINASVGATLEPVIATLLGWAFLDERVELPQLLGTLLIIVAVIVLQSEGRRPTRT